MTEIDTNYLQKQIDKLTIEEVISLLHSNEMDLTTLTIMVYILSNRPDIKLLLLVFHKLNIWYKRK